MQTSIKSIKPVWTALALPPLIFLLAIVLASIYYGAQGLTDPNQISELVASSMSFLLVGIQLAMLGLFWLTLRASGLSMAQIGWQAAPGQQAWRELALGALPGAVLGLLYVFALSPLMTIVQRTLGDYVPAGELLPSLGSGIAAFFLADVLLAPFVEENIYRGLALTRLRERFGPTSAVLISCLFFGLLHWAGGFWYMLLTGGVAGLLFALLANRRGNLLAPFGAHLALNLVEFLFVLLNR
jgi:membrane protease YdiL (CAAX protease family)